QNRDSSVPRPRESRAPDRRGRHGLAGGEERQLALDLLVVEPGEEPRDGERGGAGAATRRVEAEILSPAAGVHGAEERRSAVGLPLVYEAEQQACVVPLLREAGLDLAPLLDERHAGSIGPLLVRLGEEPLRVQQEA